MPDASEPSDHDGFTTETEVSSAFGRGNISREASSSVASILNPWREIPSFANTVQSNDQSEYEDSTRLRQDSELLDHISSSDEKHTCEDWSSSSSESRAKIPWSMAKVVLKVVWENPDLIQDLLKQILTRMTTANAPTLKARPSERFSLTPPSTLVDYGQANQKRKQSYLHDGTYSSEETERSSTARAKVTNVESLDPVIQELESLLNEAILVARSASGIDDADMQGQTMDDPKLIPLILEPKSFEGKYDRRDSITDYHSALSALYLQRVQDDTTALSSRDDSSSVSSEWSDVTDSYKISSALEDQDSGLKRSSGSWKDETPEGADRHSQIAQDTVPDIGVGRSHSKAYSSFDWATPHSVRELLKEILPSPNLKDQSQSLPQKPILASLATREQQNHLQRGDTSHRDHRIDQSSEASWIYVTSDSGLDGAATEEVYPFPDLPDRSPEEDPTSGATPAAQKPYSLKNRRHLSVPKHGRINLSRSHRRAPIARDWRTSRKRTAATVACINTALMGIIIGIYAGLVPAIQYAIVDEHHYAILGNVVFFVGLAIPTAFLYPLPLLHGRKPYVLAALACLLPLQFPPALVVSQQRDPDDPAYRTGLLVSRAVAGVVMGFVNINSFTTLLDLFGSSLQSGNPHEEVVIEHDPRRHGGGMGVWLGIWTWCFLGSIPFGFFIGALVISGLNVAWGFWLMIILTVAVLVMNVITPETRRSTYRRSMAEVKIGAETSRRIARGEIMMHLYSTGPLHWWEEVKAGLDLNIRLIKQPGFLIMMLYQGWMFAQYVIVVILLGALTSRYYRFHPQTVAVCVLSLSLGGLLAIPFQKASLFSRSRHHAQRTDSMTFEKRVTRTSHLVRRAIFLIVLPFAGLAYTLSSNGSVNVAAPCIFAALIGFLSSLALSECVGIIMETFDTSDLQAGMTGRRRSVVPEKDLEKRTNYSSFPRVTAAMSISQTVAFLLAAASTGCGGVIERAIGAQAATGVMAGILLILTLLLIGALTRFKTVQIVPSARVGTNILKGPSEDWMPVIIGTPSGTTRRISLLELGNMTRWTEIRRRNRLIDQGKM